MQAFPHRYHVNAVGRPTGDVELTAALVPMIRSASPAEFGGPGDRWSPETILVGAVADCLILTFRAVAEASALRWTAIACDAAGTLDRVERVTQFTHFDITVRLAVPPGVNADQAQRVVEKAERNCLISRSLKATVAVQVHVETGDAASADREAPAAPPR